MGRFAGKVEATIVSRERDGMKPCTHLVVGEKSSRLADCKKKLPRLKIVDASWVIECIINDKILVETRFPFTVCDLYFSVVQKKFRELPTKITRGAMICGWIGR